MDKKILGIIAIAAVSSHVSVWAQQAGAQRVGPSTAPPLAQTQQQPATAPQGGRVAPMDAPALPAQPQVQPPTVRSLAAPPVQPMPAPLPMAGAPLPRPDLVNEAIDSTAPLTPEEILRLRQELDKRARAAAQPLAPQAKPTTRVLQIDMSPGATPEVVRISRSEGTVVTFIDAAGRPWPIENADNFNPKALDIALFGKNGLSIASKVEQGIGNIAIRLEGMSGALTIRVVVGHASIREVDYTVDMQVPRYLPGAPAPVGAVVSQPAIGVDELLDFLLRTPPSTAKPLQIEGLQGGLAWQTASGRMMLRTEKLVLSPNARRRQSSSDGMTVYELPLSPVVLVSDDGRITNVRISGFSLSQEARK